MRNSRNNLLQQPLPLLPLPLLLLKRLLLLVIFEEQRLPFLLLLTPPLRSHLVLLMLVLQALQVRSCHL